MSVSPGTDVPEEVLMRVFGELDLRSLCQVALVCRAWSRAVQSTAERWKELFLSEYVLHARGGREALMVHSVEIARRWIGGCGAAPWMAMYNTQLALRKESQAVVSAVRHLSWVWDVCPVGETGAVTCTDCGVLRRWGLCDGVRCSSGSGRMRPGGCPGPQNCLECSVDVQEFVTRGRASELRLSPVGGGLGFHTALTDVVMHSDGKRVLTCGGDQKYHLCEVTEENEMVAKASFESDFVVRMALSGDLLLCTAVDEKVRLVRGIFAEGEVEDGKSDGLDQIFLEGHSDWVRSVCFVHQYGDPFAPFEPRQEGQLTDRALSGADDATVCLFDLERHLPLVRMTGPPSQAVAVDASFDGRLAVSGHSTGSVQIWDLRTAQAVLGMNNANRESMHSVAFTRDGLCVLGGANCICCNTKGRVPVFDFRTGREVSELALESGCVGSVRLTPSGRRVLICSGSALVEWFLDP